MNDNRPDMVLRSFYLAAPFFHADVNRHACVLLALASNFRLHGSNLYQLCSNANLEEMLCVTHGQLMRAKRQLRDAKLLDYDGTPGDYAALKESWEQTTGLKWEGQL